jgi:ATP-dependent phosphoenolpyruvate carboxykinase
MNIDKLRNELKLSDTAVIESSTINCNLNNGRISNSSDHIKDTNFNFSGESVSYPWDNLSSKLTKCNFDFTNCNISNYSVRWKNSGTISNCTFNGAINSKNDRVVRGGAFYLNFDKENQVTVFENCTFSNNKITNGSSNVSETGGGAIAIGFKANNCSVQFKDCNFTNNYSCSKLASHIWASANWSSDTYTNCRILLSGTNTMTNPSISELMPGKTSYKNAAVFINGITLGYN